MSAILFLLGWALRSSVLILSGLMLLRAFRVKDPSIRLGAMTALLFGSLAIPLLALVLPKLPLPVMRTAAVRVEGPVVVYDTSSMPARTRTDSASLRGGGDGARASRSIAVAPAVAAKDADAHTHGEGAYQRINWVWGALMLYGLVALTLLLRLCFGFAMTRRLLRGSRRTGQTTHGIEILESDRVASPVTLGILRPAIVLPVDWRKWGRAKVDAILAHERSHIRRNDPAVQLLSSIHRALLWHTPLSWFLHGQIVRMAEEVCDDAAVAEANDRTFYAEVLLDFMRQGLWRTSWQGLPVARYGPADQRIHRILDGTGLSRGFTWRGVATILMVGLPLAYVVACARPQNTPQAQVTPVQAAIRPPAIDALAGKPALAGGQDRIAGIVIRGNRAVPASWVRKNISLNPGDVYDPAKVESDVTTLRNTGYFEEVREETSDDPAGTMGGTVVIFYVREKDGTATRPQPAPVQPTEIPPTAIDANRVKAKIILGDFHLGRGEYENAIAAYREALNLDPSNTELRGKLDGAIKACERDDEVLNIGLKCDVILPPNGPSPAPRPGPHPSPVVAPSSARNPQTVAAIKMGDFQFGRGEYENAIAAYQEGLRADPANVNLQLKLHGAIIACRKENSILNEGLECGAPVPVVKLIPSGDFARWTKPVSKGQFVPDNNIEGGLKPVGPLSVPPLESAPSRANVVFMIGIDPNGNVTPGRKMADDNGLAPQVMTAARAWKFEPPTVNGTPVSTAVQVIVTF